MGSIGIFFVDSACATLTGISVESKMVARAVVSFNSKFLFVIIMDQNALRWMYWLVSQ